MDLQPIIGSARQRVLDIQARDGMPGVAVALVSDDAVVWSECFGVVDAPGSRPIDAHTVFSLQSTSKTVTATAVMLAVQQGLLDLDAPITAYLPEFWAQSRYEREPQTRMTLRLLLGHRAGLTHEAPLGGNFDPELETAAPDFEAHVASISGTWLRYPLGQRYAYSNLGIDLAGAALARVCGAPFAECLRRLAFQPLGMAHSSADAAVYGANPNRAIGHQPGFAAVPVRIPIEASGGVYSSVADMARFARFHLGRGRFEGRELLAPALWADMHAPRFEGFPYAVGVVRERIRLERGEAVLFNHDGGGYGFGSCFTYCPDEGLAWIALYNGQLRPGPPAPFDMVALHQALKARHGPRAPVARPAGPVIAPDRTALAPFVGTYIAGQRIMSLGWEGDVFGLRPMEDEAASPLAFTALDRAFLTAEGPRAGHAIRLHPAYSAQPAWVEFEAEDADGAFVFPVGVHFDFNGREDDPPGDVGDAYDAFLGAYNVIQWGVTVMTVPLFKTNGWLCLGPLRLTQHAPGLLFSADGELLDLTGDIPTFRNIPLHRAEGTGQA